jgi:hypothetical protein
MPFIDIARAIFAYTAASADELNIEEGDILYVLEKGDDDWWKTKKKIDGDDDGPSGLVPRNYLEEVCLEIILSRFHKYRRHGHCTITLHRQKKSYPFPPMLQSIFSTRTIRIGISSDYAIQQQMSGSTDLFLQITLTTEKSNRLPNYPVFFPPADPIASTSGDHQPHLVHNPPQQKKNPSVLVMRYVTIPRL